MWETDRSINVAHVAVWLGSTIVAFGLLAWLLLRNPLLSIGIDDAGLTIVRAAGTRKLGWAEIDAARFQEYPIAYSGGQAITCLLLRVGGKTIELTPEFRDDATLRALHEAILRELESRGIPETSDGLPSFERFLSQAGAWIFIGSILAMLVAHALGFHTLGTVFGLGFLFTGSVIAWMTRRERLSRVVLAATLLLIVGGGTILWACHVNVREVLRKWEQGEKQSSRIPPAPRSALRM